MNENIKYLKKKNCIHKENKCNHLKPFSILELYGKDKFTKDEKNENLKKYKLACKNQRGIYSSCCDKNDKKLKKLGKDLKIPKIVGKVEYDRYNKIQSVEICQKKKCGKSFKRLTPYEICKIGEDYSKNEDNNIIKKFKDDCFLTQCNPQEIVPNILGTITQNYTYEIDKNLSEAIKRNNIQLIKYYISKDKSLKTRVLTHNQEGNTIYHESIKHNSGNNIYYIFKQTTKEIAYKQNLKGDTILHMAMCTDIPNIIMFCIQLGCDINEKNNLDQTPIYCAIINNLINNVRTAINHIASLEIIDKKGNTPLHMALKLKKKNVDIVRLLVERGSDINKKDKSGKKALEIINSIDKPLKEDEEVRTYLEHITLNLMGINPGTSYSLSPTQSDDLEDVIYKLNNKDKQSDNHSSKIKINVDFTGEGDKYYDDNLDESYMQPYKVGDKNLSHEPYFHKFKNLQKDKLETLRKTVLLTKWDNKNDKKKKLKIIDNIMEGKQNFDSYKYEILNDNGISLEQEHMIFKNYSPQKDKSIKLKVKGIKQIPYDIVTDMDVPIYSPVESYKSDLNEEEEINEITPEPSYLSPAYSNMKNRTPFEIIADDYMTPFLFISIILTIGIIFFFIYKICKKRVI